MVPGVVETCLAWNWLIGPSHLIGVDLLDFGASPAAMANRWMVVGESCRESNPKINDHKTRLIYLYQCFELFRS